MAKLSRSAFLSVLATSSAFVLTGCGAGNTKDSIYAGSYSSAYSIPALNESGFFTFTLDAKGNLKGLLNNQNGKYRDVNGKVETDGTFTADTLIQGTTVKGTLSGIVSGGANILVPGAPITALPIRGGNFTLNESSLNSAGSFAVGSTPTAPGTSGFQGYYSGVYSVAELNQNGDTSFSVDSSGKVTGLFTRGDETGLLTGTLDNSGVLTATVAFRTDSITIVGTLVKTTDRSTLGNFNLTQAGKAYAGTFAASPATSTGPNTFAGSYDGTYTIPEANEDGVLSFTVDSSGAIIGSFTQNNTAPVGTLTGAFTSSGRFNGTVTYDVTTGLSPRPINGTISTGAVTAGDFIITINGTNRSGTFRVTSPTTISNYRAAYTDASIFEPAVSFGGAPTTALVDTNTAEFSIDREGSIIGSFGPYRVSGRVTNDARITGWIIGANGTKYPFRGIVNKVTWRLSASLTTPGIKGDLIFSVDGKEYTGFLKATGGDGTTTQ